MTVTVTGTKTIQGANATVYTRSDSVNPAGNYDQYFAVGNGGVTALGNTMTVAGSMQLAQPEGGRFVWQEFSQGPTQFRREITLPTEVDPARVEARYQNGVLTMIAPKAEHAMPREIKVKS